VKLPRPSYWGKLPAYGDFLRHGAPTGIQEVWRAWQNGPLELARTARACGVAHEMPWSFVMTPGCLKFSRDRYVAGVYADSRDKFGREHPFLLWFQLDCAGVSSLLGTHDNALFCLSRMLIAHLNAPAAGAAEGFVGQLNQLWRAPGGGVWGALRRRRDAPEFTLARAWTEGWAPVERTPGLSGVPYAPWRDWPATVFGDSAQAWYWQQDAHAGYVNFLSVGAETPAGHD